MAYCHFGTQLSRPASQVRTGAPLQLPGETCFGSSVLSSKNLVSSCVEDYPNLNGRKKGRWSPIRTTDPMEFDRPTKPFLTRRPPVTQFSLGPGLSSVLFPNKTRPVVLSLAASRLPLEVDLRTSRLRASSHRSKEVRHSVRRQSRVHEDINLQKSSPSGSEPFKYAESAGNLGTVVQANSPANRRVGR